jgi:hypothetical protein
MPYTIQIKPIVLLLIFAMVQSCDSTPPVSDEDPENLVVEVIQSENDPGLVMIEAVADNTVEYRLYIGDAEQAEAINTTGLFEYTFIQSGTYLIDVRAYGTSGRFIKVSRQVVIDLDDGVPLDSGYVSPLTYENYDLVWNDEFNSSEIDEANWVFETGSGCPNLCGWGNNELQYYRKDNAWIEEDVLVIEARNESFQGSGYTSARLKTQGKYTFRYGRVDIRALLPEGQGIWPALWMLGENITSIGWPACGEIDIMEMIGGEGRENEVHGTLHWDNDGHTFTGKGYTLGSGVFADEYHVFSIEWDPSSIRWFVNNIKFHEISITASHMSEFQENFFFVINIAVGGNWPGSPDETTVFPQQMKVDYIRVFQ